MLHVILPQEKVKKNHLMSYRLITKGTKDFCNEKIWWGTSLVVQWLNVCPSVQGTWVPSLVQKILDATEGLSPHSRAPEPQLLSLCATTTEA